MEIATSTLLLANDTETELPAVHPVALQQPPNKLYFETGIYYPLRVFAEKWL